MFDAQRRTGGDSRPNKHMNDGRQLLSSKLEHRPNDLIMCDKIVLNIVHLEFSDFIVFNTSSVGGHPYKVYLSCASANVRR